MELRPAADSPLIPRRAGRTLHVERHDGMGAGRGGVHVGAPHHTHLVAEIKEAENIADIPNDAAAEAPHEDTHPGVLADLEGRWRGSAATRDAATTHGCGCRAKEVPDPVVVEFEEGELQDVIPTAPTELGQEAIGQARHKAALFARAAKDCVALAAARLTAGKDAAMEAPCHIPRQALSAESVDSRLRGTGRHDPVEVASASPKGWTQGRRRWVAGASSGRGGWRK
mmetsp:Transcript_33064/g.74783  ORF Transcript_33064/g.74783 Transcript_33064/m.74783 type:complete len:227 (-) Transcript_33064:202-882(-)